MKDYLLLIKEKASENLIAFNKKIVPDTKYEMLGVKVPDLKEIGKKIAKRGEELEYLRLPKRYYEEYFASGFAISYSTRDYDEKIKLFDEFINCIDNWAICDSVVLASKFIGKNKKKSLEFIEKWLKSKKPYIIRVAVVCLLGYYIVDEYIDYVLLCAKTIQSDDYYVNMALSWLVSVALVKFYDKTIKYLENREFKTFIHNKSIQKAVESFRVSPSNKEQLKKLKIK